ncbi:MAG: HAMP domain-containing histidine kinase [Oscillospiraceae bacterium]|nr:HAMP domain-containing histidine kinase [Oscillospiraceae bacterium]
MTIETELRQILELMGEPAFCAAEGQVIAANQSARELGICPGQAVDSLLKTGSDDYAEFEGGVLFLSMAVGGTCLTARVSKFRNTDLFVLEPEDADPSLQALALAAQTLRKPLGNVMTSFDQLAHSLPEEDKAQAEALCRMNRGFHQLLRLVNNMSDASTAGVCRMEIRNVTAVLREMLERCETLLEGTEIRLVVENSPESIYSLIDSRKLERAVYNLLSNAIKHTPKGGTIRVALTRRNRAMLLTVTNDLPEGTELGADSFSRYLRSPSLGSAREGLGLGIPLVRSVAAAHQGTLLLQHDGRRMRAVIRLPICQETSGLRSPSLSIDQDGGHDRGLIELSDVLPPECFLLK